MEICMTETPPNSSTIPDNTTDSQLYEVPLDITILISVLYGIISLLAILGNGLVLFVICTSRRMRTTTNYFIGNLAVADVIIGVFSIPFQFQSALLQRWNLADIMCPISEFCSTLSVSVSVFTLTAIAVDRYRAILYRLITHRSRPRAKVMIGLIWLLGVALALPQALWLRVCLYWDDSVGAHKRFCDYQGVDNVARDAYFYSRICFQYFLPLVVITFCYTRVACELRGAHVPGNADTSRDAVLLSNKRKVLKMLVIVVVMFMVCWLPFQLYYVLQSIHPEISGFPYINVIFFSCHWLAMANSCCNPFIYGIYNEKFKREFRRRFQRSSCVSVPEHSFSADPASEELRSRVSVQRSLRSRLMGRASTKTTVERINSLPLKEFEHTAARAPRAANL